MFNVKLDYNMSAWKKTLIAGLISYIDAGSIVAGASGLTMWQDYLGMSSVQMGLLAALSSNTGGAAIGALIGGAVITETIFAWKGMGSLFVDGLERGDVNLVMGFFLVTGILAVLFNLIADLLYSALDPRIRVS